MGFYPFGHRPDRGAFGIHRNRFRRGWHRQVPVLSVPGHVFDPFRHRHINREKDNVIGSRPETSAPQRR
jgi:hypothetical protein